MPKAIFLGVIKSYDPARGFGFVYADNEKRDFFFHITAVAGPSPPNIGDKVSFSLKEKNGKLSAHDVEITARKSREVKKKTLQGFPCIRGGSIKGFKIDKTIRSVITTRCNSVDEARDELLREAESCGADAVFYYVWHRESDLHNAWFLIWHVGKYRETTFWAEGDAVKLVPV